MENKSNITVIIPLNGLSEKDVPFFMNAVNSLKNLETKPDEVIITTCECPDLVKFINEFDFTDLNVTKIVNPDANSYAKQINFAASKVKTKYFSILEFDDEYSKKWFTHVLEYEKHYPDIKVWMPIVVDVTPEKQFLGLTNEAVWAMNFSDEIGVLDNQALNNYPNFQTSGAVYETDSFVEHGGFKNNIKLTFGYELLLRLSYQSVNIMTIPKVGYIHTNLRENSLFWAYKNDPQQAIKAKDAEFWIQTAKKEYFFPHDRDIELS
jgi:hypothetical protein